MEHFGESKTLDRNLNHKHFWGLNGQTSYRLWTLFQNACTMHASATHLCMIQVFMEQQKRPILGVGLNLCGWKMENSDLGKKRALP